MNMEEVEEFSRCVAADLKPLDIQETTSEAAIPKKMKLKGMCSVGEANCGSVVESGFGMY